MNYASSYATFTLPHSSITRFEPFLTRIRTKAGRRCEAKPLGSLTAAASRLQSKNKKNTVTTPTANHAMRNN
jgi:hypothetical protein